MNALLLVPVAVLAAADPASAVRVVDVDVVKGPTATAVAKEGCVVVGVAAHPNAGLRRALFARVCRGDDDIFTEERGVVDGRAGRVRYRVRDVDPELGPRLLAAKPGAAAQLLRASADDGSGEVSFVRALFLQPLTPVPRSLPGRSVAWSKSGARFAVSLGAEGDWVPHHGYSQPAAFVVDFETLMPVLDEPAGAIDVVAFEGEHAVVSVLGARCAAPTTVDELVRPTPCHAPNVEALAGERMPTPRSGVSMGEATRWEAVVDVGASPPALVKVSGPFEHDAQCGERGPRGVKARYRVRDGRECR